MDKAKEKNNVLPLRKADPNCFNGQSYITNALFLIGMASQSEEFEEEVARATLQLLIDLIEPYQENELEAELIYRDLLKIKAQIESFYSSESTFCPNCKGSNILVDEGSEETENTCLDCKHLFTTE